MITVSNVSLNFSGEPLFKEVNVKFTEGNCYGVIGANGAGKSTFLKILSGELDSTTGDVSIKPGTRMSVLKQDHFAYDDFTVLDTIIQGNPRLYQIMQEKDEIYSHDPFTEEDGNRAAELEAEFAEMDGWNADTEASQLLEGLGLNSAEVLYRPLRTLQDSEKVKVLLAQALFGHPDILLLDEPTNHLDIKTIAWLEDFLVRRVKTFVFISHDRAFVRRLATRIVEVDRSQLYSYACTFDQFLERREERLDAEEKQAAAFDKKLAQEEAWIRQGIKARRTRNMGRVRALQAMRSERMARVSRQGVVSMLAQEAERSGKLVIEAKQAGFAYPDGYRVFNPFSTIIQRGDRIGLIGNNGVGKTTLLRLLLGELEPTEGSIRHGTRLEVSYFDQLRSSLDPEKSVMDNVANGNDTVTINGQQRHVASYLMDFLFESDRLRVPVHTLSGGERNRLLLAKLFTMPSNLLVLDEPTNDLDVETLELLEELLASYSGTVLMVSHDREFLDNLVTTTLALEGDGQVREYVGGYTDWLRQRPEPVAAHTDKPKPKPLAPPAKIGPRKLTFKEQRELQMLKDELEALPGKMAALEDEQHTLEDRLNDPGFFARDPDGFNATAKRISELDDEQTAALQRWEDVEFRIAELEGKAEDK